MFYLYPQPQTLISEYIIRCDKETKALQRNESFTKKRKLYKETKALQTNESFQKTKPNCYTKFMKNDCVKRKIAQVEKKSS